MKIRASRISQSIADALTTPTDKTDDSSADPAVRHDSLRLAIIARLVALFSFFRLPLARYRPSVFVALRHGPWQLAEAEYLASFRAPHAVPAHEATPLTAPTQPVELIPIGDLGYSGSTFFTTPDGKFLVKSLPRRFEHTFFTHDLLDAYAAHMHARPHSLLVRIADMVYTPRATLGGICGTAPTHHIVMENLLYGKPTDHGGGAGWESYDLKPESYFFPERDIANGRLAPDSVIDGLVDTLPGPIRVSAAQRKQLFAALDADTELLAAHNAVDYSLFVVRYPTASETPPATSAAAHPWRAGLEDADGQWTYRVVVLDFFWAKHKFHARAMTGLVKTFNLLARKGPMSITAEPPEYRQRFLKMVEDIVEVVE